MQPRGRAYWRQRVLAERFSGPKRAPEYRGELDYDRIEIMEKIDSLPRGWRMRINEHGFSAVMKARQYSTDINVVEKMMRQRREMRQHQLAEGRA